jgi:hypothetical protein
VESWACDTHLLSSISLTCLRPQPKGRDFLRAAIDHAVSIPPTQSGCAILEVRTLDCLTRRSFHSKNRRQHIRPTAKPSIAPSQCFSSATAPHATKNNSQHTIHIDAKYSIRCPCVMLRHSLSGVRWRAPHLHLWYSTPTRGDDTIRDLNCVPHCGQL